MQVKTVTGFDVYFATPYSPSQRGCNENVSSLLRQFIPKRMGLAAVDQSKLDGYVRLFKKRSPKHPGYRTPNEVLKAARRIALGT